MKTACAPIALLLLLFAPAAYPQKPANVSSADVREVLASFHALFQAMKAGNVAVIEKYFSGPMSLEYQTLLKKNQDYPAFLRNFYKGATFRITKVTPAGNGDVVVDVVIQLGGGSTSTTQLVAKRFNGSPAQWRVTRLVHANRGQRKVI
jgi:hypothetical protein